LKRLDCLYNGYLSVSSTKNNHTYSNLEICEVTVLNKDHLVMRALTAHLTPTMPLQWNLMNWMGTFETSMSVILFTFPFSINHKPCLIWEKQKLLTKKSIGCQFVKPPAILISYFPVLEERAVAWPDFIWINFRS
jgi:hypothetical protein